MQIVILSDRSIKEQIWGGRVVIKPLGDGYIQSASVDVRLANEFLVFRNSRRAFIDPREDMRDLTEKVTIESDETFMLHPGEFVLAGLLEYLEVPDDLVVRLQGRSSLGRLGLVIHSTAGYVDPGWKGRLTLELSNVSNLPIALYPEMKIGQLTFLQLSTPAERLYGSKGLKSKYQGQMGPSASRAFKDYRRA